jgi:hypothetical protein
VQADPRWFYNGLVNYPGSIEKEYDLCRIQNMLANELGEKGVNYIDVLPIFREYIQQGETICWNRDGHLTTNGHRILSEILFEYFEANPDIFENNT